MKFIFGKDFDEKYILSAIELDKKYYNNSQIVSLDQCLNWSSRNEYIYVGAIDEETNSLVGYLNIMPVDDEIVNDVLMDNFNDIDLSSSKILTPSMSNNSSLYLASAVAHLMMINDNKAKNFMYKLLYEFLLNHAKKNIYFKQIIAEAFTEDGKKFAENLGLTLKHRKNSSLGIYHIDLVNNRLNFNFNNSLELERLYNEYQS